MSKDVSFFLKNMPEERKNYINDRVIDQIEWYDKKAVINQKKYKQSMIIITVVTALIPIMTILYETCESVIISIVIALLGAIATTLTVIVKLCEYQKLWLQYRATCQNLIHELYRFFNKIDFYENSDEEKSYKLFVENIENILLNEVNDWVLLDHKATQ